MYRFGGLKKLAMASGLLVVSAYGFTAEQTLTMDPAAISTRGGAEGVSITASYATSDAAKTTGVGVSLYFDSTKLSFVSLAGSDALGAYVLSATTTPDAIQDDSNDSDSDSSTDKEAIIAFTSFTGAFPASGEAFTVVFNVLVEDGSAGSTQVNFKVDPAAGYTGVAEPVVITFVKDSDGDGLSDDVDPDDDNDGVEDADDAFPLDTTESVDTDGDGIGNNTDTDDDGDGVSDAAETLAGTNPLLTDTDADGVADGLDLFPLNNTEAIDTDGDGIGNNADTDDDNDTVLDNVDAFPLDSAESVDTDSDGTGNNADTDDDNDGVDDANDAFPLDDSESIDTDADGTGNNSDSDDDNDGVSDSDEAAAGTDPLLSDTDADGTADGVDAFPLDETETIDTDEDGTGNNADTDDDNDTVLDNVDAFPLDSTETVDTDGDGTGNNADTDDDNDNVLDDDDAFPLDAAESVDTDADGTGNNADSDDDNDTVPDVDDAFPLDATETVDTDADGTGNNADTDDDNDTVLDANDAFPLDATESVDTDADGTGNNADTDDDNDTVLDALDAFPLDATESLDTDADGTGNNADTDDDNDGVLDTQEALAGTNPLLSDTDSDGVADGIDAFPLDAAETVDTDLDGTGNNADTDDDNDGILDEDDVYPLVRDLVLPTIAAPANITVEASSSTGLAASSSQLTAYLSGATANDNIDGDISNKSTNNAPTTFPLGTTTVTFSVVDTSNNAVSAASTVTVSDTTKPQITVESVLRISLDVTATLLDSDERIAAYLASATAVDTVSGSIAVVVDAPESYELGTAAVTFSAVDAAGNTAVVNASIIISLGPQVTAPDDLVIVSIDGVGMSAEFAAIANFLAAATAVDMDGAQLSVTNDAPEILLVGVNTITFSATDAEDRVGVANATVTVLVASVDTDTDEDGIDDLFEVTYGLDPNVADGDLDSDKDGLSNLEEYLQGLNPTLDDVAPVVSAPADLVVNSTGLKTAVALGVATANDALDGALSITSDLKGPFAPGRYTLTWTATDAAGNSASDTQDLDVVPLASLVNKVRTAEGKSVTLNVELNGDAPEYPVVIPYTLAGTASIDDGDYLIDGVSAGQAVTIESGRTGAIELALLDDGVADEGVETIELTLVSLSDDGESILTNAVLGVSRTVQVNIVDAPAAPSLSIEVAQGDNKGRYISVDGGEVNITVKVQDPNGVHTFDWSASDNNLVALEDSAQAASLIIDPVAMTAGSYKAEVIVNDDQILDKTFKIGVMLILKDAAVESDSDQDGIPDSKDTSSQSNVLSLDADNNAASINAESGVKLVIGDAAAAAGVAGALITEADIASGGEDGGDAPSNGNDEDFDFPLGLLDFVIQDLPEPGQSVRIVIPLPSAIPANATYRKYTEATGWVAFMSDSNNSVSSAPGSDGACPEVGADDYIEGLAEGDFCIQLQLEDGGENDADGEANGSVDDPGGIATETPVEPEPTPTPAPVVTPQHKSQGGGCSVGSGSVFDPMLPLMLLLAALALLRQSLRRKSSRHSTAAE
jgi:hypothetical protein